MVENQCLGFRLGLEILPLRGKTCYYLDNRTAYLYLSTYTCPPVFIFLNCSYIPILPVYTVGDVFTPDSGTNIPTV
jgi:hypothetical protein